MWQENFIRFSEKLRGEKIESKKFTKERKTKHAI